VYESSTVVRPMMAETIPHNRLTFGEAECEAVAKTIRSGQWAQGPRVQELEVALSQMSGVDHAVCVSSGFSALRLSLGALGVRSSDSVVVPAYSCVALANAALAWGATPVPVDVEPVGWNVLQRDCCRAIARCRPRSVIAVNTFGMPAEIDEIITTGVPVIEDCAHAFGLAFGGKWLGSRTQVGALSFYATKLIGGGEGGAVLTNSREIAEYVRSARDYGDQPAAAHRMNDKMSDLEASLVLTQLKRLPELISVRETIARRYLNMLSGQSVGRLFRLPTESTVRVWYRFVVEMLTVSAETLVAGLQRFGVHAAIPVTDWRPACSPPAPIADRAYRQLVSLPLYPTLTPDEQDSVVKAFLKFCEDSARA
jgi:dTDP-4-amino-4,6-dideoxygalactose transaminase